MLKQRIITALILAPLAILAILFLPLDVFQYVIAGVIALGGYEWANMSGLPKRPHKIAFLFVGHISVIEEKSSTSAFVVAHLKTFGRFC